MELLQQLIQFVLHIDKHLFDICAQYGAWVYAILFIIIFCETGFVVTPFLPGDSLLFAVGSLAAIGALNVWSSILLLVIAAFAGDTANYWIGHFIGPKIFHKEHVRFLNKEYLERTHRFYEKHGGKTIILARFLPIIRTFAPFVAGIGSMTYPRFMLYNLSGGILWVVLFTLGGYFFGNVPFIKQNFSLVIVALIIIPGLPAAVEFIRQAVRRTKKTR
ncbi:MAG: DedA family protein [Ignavibacteriae bacterium]|nr:MAG: DedA family protein [Ignavibacteriota bacterium]